MSNDTISIAHPSTQTSAQAGQMPQAHGRFDGSIPIHGTRRPILVSHRLTIPRRLCMKKPIDLIDLPKHRRLQAKFSPARGRYRTLCRQDKSRMSVKWLPSGKRCKPSIPSTNPVCAIGTKPLRARAMNTVALRGFREATKNQTGGLWHLTSMQQHLDHLFGASKWRGRRPRHKQTSMQCTVPAVDHGHTVRNKWQRCRPWISSL